MKKNAIVIFAAVVLSAVLVLGCNRIEGKKLYAPMTEEQISALVVPGISKEELLTRCGNPFRTETKGQTEEIVFMLSMDNVHAPSDWMMASFKVIVSNNVVVSWKQNSTARVR